MTWIPLSSSRRSLVDMLNAARKIPTIPVARRMNVSELVRARQQSPTAPPSWSSLFLRAYGLVGVRFNQLRRAWLSWPRAHLYEHPVSIANVAVEREWQGEDELFFGQVRDAEHSDLATIQERLRYLKVTPFSDLKGFHRQLLLGKIPSLLRRLWMWQKLDWSGAKRVKYLGTYCFTNYGMFGAESLHPLSLQTTVMTLSPIEADGMMTVKLVYDHRVLNGGYVARALDHLEEVLHQQVLPEIGRSAQAA